MAEDSSFFEEHAIAERRGMLGGKRIATVGGKFEKTIFVVACDYCGYYPLNEFVICRSCRGKLCDDCYAKLDGRSYCRGCLMEIIPLSSNCYKVLMCIVAGVKSSRKISDLTRISKEDVRLCLSLLSELKLVESSGLLGFMERRVSASGVRTLHVFRKMYGQDQDVVEVEQKLVEDEDSGD